MLLLVVDRRLTSEVADWVVDAVADGVRQQVDDVVLRRESGVGSGEVVRRPQVCVLVDDVPKDDLFVTAAAADQVVYVTVSLDGGLRERLGLARSSTWSTDLSVVWLSDDPPPSRGFRVAGCVRVIHVSSVPVRSGLRRLRRLGRKVSFSTAVAPRSDPLNAQAVRRSAAAISRALIQDLIDRGVDGGVEEYQIIGCRQMITHTAANTRVLQESPFTSDEQLIDVLRHLAAFGGDIPQRFDPLDPRVDMQIGEQWRLHGEAWVTNPPTMVLRYNQGVKLAVSDLGVCDDVLEKILVTAVASSNRVGRGNIVIAAPMSGGKTTLAQALLGEVSALERIDTIEDTPELRLLQYKIHPQTYERLTRDANNDGVGAYSMASHIRDAKRCNSDKLVVGEVRGEGTMALLDAMSSGLSGCLVTIHSHPGRGVIDKLLAYAACEGADLSYCRQQIAGAVDLLVWMGRDLNGERRIGDVTQIVGYDDGNDRIVTRSLWRALPDVSGVDGWAVPVAMPSGRVKDIYAAANVVFSGDVLNRNKRRADC